ncbi:MAG: phosphoribosylanthranilate isomerase [Prevotella sp.]|nr:phosphoribosylanthranilate isomerase [Prevotella sp.]MBR1839134.1 phosphoribosylanthranilate isomerase [Prevotella sp.]
MTIKVCGMREPDNIRAVSELGIDMMGFIFYPKSPRYVRSINTHAGIIPNMANEKVKDSSESSSHQPLKVGVFVDEMPQTVITHAYNYELDYIQLHGEESPIYIENLKRTLIPDILPDIKIIKAISISNADDIDNWKQYEGCIDMLLFDTKCKTYGGSGEQYDWEILKTYDGTIPFLLSGGIGPDDAERIKTFKHPMCTGIDLNSRFEDAPGIKNVDKLKTFLTEIQ